MFSHTKAFADFKELSQTHIDFVVVVCHAVPTLQADIALPNTSLTYPPDHFKQSRNPKPEVARKVPGYQSELARSTLITVFSYFESYVKDALKEVVEFHGGKTKFKGEADRRSKKFINVVMPSVQKSKRKLQDQFDKAKIEKYQKHIRILEGHGFNFPTDLLSHFGVVYLIQKLDERRGMRAWEIPDILEECLLFPITRDERDHYENIRLMRNKIAHGKPPTLTLKDSLYYSSVLHTLAAKVDRHIAEHFLVIQEA